MKHTSFSIISSMGMTSDLPFFLHVIGYTGKKSVILYGNLIYDCLKTSI